MLVSRLTFLCADKVSCPMAFWGLPCAHLESSGVRDVSYKVQFIGALEIPTRAFMLSQQVPTDTPNPTPPHPQGLFDSEFE